MTQDGAKTTTTTIEIKPGGPLRGRIRTPGDKSISHRALLLAARAEGVSQLRGLSMGDDVLRTQAAMTAMGAHIIESNGTESNGTAANGTVSGRVLTADRVLTVEGGRQRLHEPQSVIDLGNSGTGIRLMAGWCAGFPWLTILHGDASLARRPMGRVAEPLRAMGARVDGRNNGNLPPLAIRGGGLKGIEYESVHRSAQVKSAILLAGLEAEGETVVHEPVLTRVHTEEMLAAAGVNVHFDEHADGSATVRLAPGPLRPFSIDVPGDPSQAAFWLVAALVVPQSDVTIERVYVGPARTGLLDVLVRMGADIEITHHDASTADLRVRSSYLRATDVGGEEIPSLIDELPVLAVAAAFAEGTTTVSDAAEMRVKESDRIATTTQELSGMGVQITERPDGFVVQGRPGQLLDGGSANAHLDHRIAMTAAVAGLASRQATVIKGWESVTTSYPSFCDDLARLQGSVL